MKNVIVNLIRVYQKWVSVFFAPRCRFYPSCSDYAIKVVEKKGIIIGAFLAIWRICRCNPLFPGGHDPIK